MLLRLSRRWRGRPLRSSQAEIAHEATEGCSGRRLAPLRKRSARRLAQFLKRRGSGLRAPKERAGPLDILVPIVVEPLAVETAR